MLPATGGFNNINCPFFESGLCERPHCHYKHAKRESTNPQLLSKLVSEAVHQVLNDDICSEKQAEDIDQKCSVVLPEPPRNVTYNPTPISELNKQKQEKPSKDKENVEKRSSRHIPIQYTPERPSPRNATYSNSEYVVDESSSLSIGYSPTPKSSSIVNTSEVSYIPSSIKALSEQTNSHASAINADNSQYVPSSSSPSDLLYNPTCIETVANANDISHDELNFIDEFLNDPNIYEAQLSNLQSLGFSKPYPSHVINHTVIETANKDSSLNEKKSDKYRKSRSSDKDKRSNKSKGHVSNGVNLSAKPKTTSEKQQKSSSDKSKHCSSSVHNDKYKSSSKKSSHRSESSDKSKASLNSECSNERSDSSKTKSKERNDHKTNHELESLDKVGKSKTSHSAESSDKSKSSHRESKDKSKSGRSDSNKSKSKNKTESSDKSKSSHRSESSDKSNSKSHSNHRSESTEKTKTSERSDKRPKKHAKSPTPPKHPSPEKVSSEDEGIMNCEDVLSDDDYDMEITMRECKKIFDEYQPPSEDTHNNLLKVEPKQTKDDEIALSACSKKRVAHENSKNIARERKVKSKSAPNAATIMANRYKIIAESSTIPQLNDRELNTAPNHLIQTQSQLIASKYRIVDPSEHLLSSSKITLVHILNESCSSPKKLKMQEDVSNGDLVSTIMNAPSVTKVQGSSSVISTACTFPAPAKARRIAHVPNVSSLLTAKKKVEQIAKSKEVTKTPMQTVKYGKRVAHTPEVNLADIPTVLSAEKSKLPVNIRTRYLQMMITESSKLYLSRNAAIDRALNEELICYNKCSAISTYRNSAMLSVNRLRKEVEAGQNGLSGSTGDDTSEYAGLKFYHNLEKWILTSKELDENGFPRPGAPLKGRALFNDNKVYESLPLNTQRCVRCKKTYTLNENGFALNSEDCIYHPNGRYVFRGEAQYICCRGNSAADGCCICPTHVYEIKDPSKLTGFICTFEPDSSRDPKNIAVYALDCEMIYTTRGFELARVTVINHKCETVYESMCRPLGVILDCNTRFSGITQEALERVNTTFTEVQASLLHMFNSKTILIGHSLESDLKALRLIHETVIDTSVLFPHKMGPPKKRALRTLASEYLKKIIQNDEGGHDSAEDAITCMELLIWKLKEELKTR